MRILPTLLLACALSIPVYSPAQTAADSAAIVAVMNKSAEDWNRGDLDAFATCYKKSPEILFIGSTISRGYEQMVASYKKNYASREKMGKLNFAHLEVQPLDARYATVTGNFHLERTSVGGGNSDGYFLLVFEKTAEGWKIVRDDSTELPPPVKK